MDASRVIRFPTGEDVSLLNSGEADQATEGRGGVRIDPDPFHSDEPPPSSHRRVLRRIGDVRMPPGGFLSDLLARIERTRSTYSLAFESTAGVTFGEVLIAEGEICLVTPRGGGLPLGVRLQQRFPETAAAVREALDRVKAEGRPLREVLTALGTVRSDQIRASMLDQIADGLSLIARAAPHGMVETCLSVSRRRVPTVLSAFSPADVYWRAMPLTLPAVEDAATRAFHELAEIAEAAILIARGKDEAGGEPIPIHARGVDDLSVAEALTIGRAIEHTAAAPALIAAGISPRAALLKTADGAMICVTTEARVAVLGGLDPAAQARALARVRALLGEEH